MLYVVHVSLDIHEQHDLVFHNTNKDYLYVNIVSLCFVRGLNLVLSICMGSSCGKVIKCWVGVVRGKLFCVIDVGSWHLSC